MNSHYDPNHPRFLPSAAWHDRQRLRLVPRLSHELKTTDKRGGTRYYMAENLTAIARPRKRATKTEEGVTVAGDWIRKHAGNRIVRVDRQGERLVRARNMEPGVSGKSFRRRFRKELRDEKAKANA